MTERRYTFTSESVTEGHPDKMADQISDAVLDSILEKDPTGRVACEALITTGLVIVAGEITTDCYVEIPHIVRSTIEEIGYTRAKYGFDFETCGVLTAIQEQSKDIGKGVDTGGAGDQGMMYGFAIDETAELMPMPIMVAHKLAKRLAQVRKENIIEYLRPDGKSQVTIEYENDKPVRVDRVVVSAQHKRGIDHATIKKDIIEKVIKVLIPAEMLDERTKFYVNPTGSFETGGPQADTGLTGRKIIVDTYGGMARHGGGCFSGKDPTKVDRSAGYMLRYIAKNIVAAGLARKCEVQVAYAIGEAEPLAMSVDTFGSGKIDDSKLLEIIKKHFDLRPGAIIERLDLRRAIYKQVAAYGHFGRNDLDVPWEKTDIVDVLRGGAGL